MTVTMYSLKVCPNCGELKTALNTLDIKFIEKDLESPESKTRMLMHRVFTAVAPILEVDGQYHTFDDLFPHNELDIENLKRIVGI